MPANQLEYYRIVVEVYDESRTCWRWCVCSLCFSEQVKILKFRQNQATHFLLAHLSVKSTSWILRREFPIAPSFRPSAVPLLYSELDTASRAAINEHLRHINGSEDDMAAVNWALDSCWKINDIDEWFSFAIVLLCCPVARALRRGSGRFLIDGLHGL